MAATAPPESVVLGQFTGLKNTVSRERLAATELERAINVDIDDSGQLSRRRGYKLKLAGRTHSARDVGDKVLVVLNGALGQIDDNYLFTEITEVGDARVVYTEVNGEIYFCNSTTSGVIARNGDLFDWGRTAGQGLWLSPVETPTDTLGEVSGKLLGDPILASEIEAFNGRIYLAEGKTLWATELFNYHYVDKTKGFMQFEHEITLVMAVDNGLYVGTTGGLYFLQGVMHQFKLAQIGTDAVLRGSGQYVPAELVNPAARNQPMPSGAAVVFMTAGGILAGFENGTAYNLTLGTMVFPEGVSAASLFRQDQGANSYVAAVDSAGGPSSRARIGDYVDAEIVRRL